MMLRALITDDEAPARAELRYLLERIGGVEVVGEAASVREALSLARHVTYDVVFLDINMPDLTGIDAARELNLLPHRPAVVFVTAHDDHAVQAFAVDAVDYLLKPLDEERLARCVARLVALRTGDARRSEPALTRIPVHRGGDTILLDVDEIVFAEADGDISWLVTAAGERLAGPAMRELEDALPASRFFRIHRSHLINLSRVTTVEAIAPGRVGVRLADGHGTQLEVARRQTRALRHALGLR